MAVGTGMATGVITNMAYEQDDDRVTRGVGAIAAADKVSPGRYRRRIETGIATRKRDRAMAAITNGALSGTSIARPVLKQVSRPSAASPLQALVSGVKSAAPRSPLQALVSGVKSVVVASPLRPVVSGATSAIGGSLRLPPIVVVPPRTGAPVGVPPPVSVLIAPISTPPATTTATAPTASTTIIGGTGPSTQGSPMKGVISAIFDPIPNAPGVPIVETDNTIRNIALAGGAALAAYLLFFRRSA